jgi:hypothetical protein
MEYIDRCTSRSERVDLISAAGSFSSCSLGGVCPGFCARLRRDRCFVLGEEGSERGAGGAQDLFPCCGVVSSFVLLSLLF